MDFPRPEYFYDWFFHRRSFIEKHKTKSIALKALRSSDFTREKKGIFDRIEIIVKL